MAEGRSRAAQVWFGHLDRARAEGVSLKAYADYAELGIGGTIPSLVLCRVIRVSSLFDQHFQDPAEVKPVHHSA